MSRKDDKTDSELFFQMDRFMHQNGEWYYTTREGDEKGPFESRADAEIDLVAYITLMRKPEGSGE